MISGETKLGGSNEKSMYGIGGAAISLRRGFCKPEKG
jgi:hypothetical protein